MQKVEEKVMIRYCDTIGKWQKCWINYKLLLVKLAISDLSQYPSIIVTWLPMQTIWVFVGYGLHQGFWAVIIHSFEGVHLTSGKEQDAKSENFLYKTIATTSSCGGEITGLVQGGINYHIEHHLFPRVNHMHFPKLRPIVREFCAEKGVPYNYFPSVWGNFKSFVKHLYILGNNDAYNC